jgi:hypothetical protein
MRDGGFRFNLRVADGVPSHPQAMDPLLIEDPVNVLNNIGKNCYKVAAVQGVLMEALEKLKTIAVRHNSSRNSGRFRRGIVSTTSDLAASSSSSASSVGPGLTNADAVVTAATVSSTSGDAAETTVSVPSVVAVVGDKQGEIDEVAAPSFVRTRVKDLSAKILKASEPSSLSVTPSLDAQETTTNSGTGAVVEAAATLEKSGGTKTEDPSSLTLLREVFFHL